MCPTSKLLAQSLIHTEGERGIWGFNCGGIGAVNYRGKRLRPSQAPLWWWQWRSFKWGALHQLGSQWEERELGPDELASTLRASGPYGSQYGPLFYLFNLFNQWQALLTEWRAQRLFQCVIHFEQICIHSFSGNLAILQHPLCLNFAECSRFCFRLHICMLFVLFICLMLCSLYFIFITLS